MSRINWKSRIHRMRLRRLLGLTDKLDANYEGRFENVSCPNDYGDVAVVANVVVTKTKGPTSKHRVFVECPTCKELIPAGRYHQHNPVHKTVLT